MALNLTRTVAEYLKENSGKKFTARQIADWIFQTYPEECKKKQKKSKAKVIPLDTDEALIQQLVKEIGAQKPRLEQYKIKTTANRPREYYFTDLSDIDEIEAIEEQDNITSISTSVKEHDLYPMLSEYLKAELNVFSKRIDEKNLKIIVVQVAISGYILIW